MSEEVERALAGAALRDPESVLAVCRETLTSPGDVADPKSRDVLTLLNRMVEDGEPTDLIAVAQRAKTEHLPWRSEASTFLFDLYEQAPGVGSAGWYARQVAAEAHRRRLASVGTKLRQMSEAPDYDPRAATAAAGDLLNDLEDPDSESRSGPVSLLSLVEPGLDRLETEDHERIVSTGVPRLDALTHGLRPGQLIVLAARPSIGKTTMALGLARAAAIVQGVPTLMFSLEMTKEEVFDRVVAAEARVPLTNLIDRDLGETGWQRVARSMTSLNEAPLLIDDTPDVGLGYIRTTSRRMVRRHGVGLIVIDYLGLLAISTGRGGSRERAVADVSRGLKLLGKSLGVPVVLVAQLNRDIEKRPDKDKKPMLSDLRESGALESDADVVLLLHREEFYKPNTSRVGEVDVIVAKNRNGPTGVVDLLWSGKYARIAESDLQMGLV